MTITEIKLIGDTGVEYTISVVDGVVRCTCPSHKHRGGVCKHMLFAAKSLPMGSAAAQVQKV